MDWILMIMAFAVGTVLGAALLFVWSKSQLQLKMALVEQNLKETQEQLAAEKEINLKLTSKLEVIEKENTQHQVKSSRDSESLRIREEEIQQLKVKNEELSKANRNHELQQTRLESETKHLGDLLNKLQTEREELQKRMTNEFENLANKIFEEKSEKMNQQASSKLGDLLNPFSENMKELKKKVEETYQSELKERSSLQGELKKLFELNQTLSQEANNLTKALKGENKTQGNWGELILESLLERSGLRNGFEYQTQESFTGEAGRRLQPDVVIHLPENRKMIIDSKVSLVAFEKYVNAEDQQQAAIAGQELVRSLKAHIKGLSEKSYQDLFPDSHLDFVLLFIPIEPAFATVLQLEGQLFQDAFEKHILLVSPATLMATLKVVANIWRQENQNRNALEIARQAGNMYDKVVSIYSEFQKLGNQLSTVQKTYDGAVKMIGEGKGNLITRVESLKNLGAKASKSLPADAIENAREELFIESDAQDY